MWASKAACAFLHTDTNVQGGGDQQAAGPDVPAGPRDKAALTFDELASLFEPAAPPQGFAAQLDIFRAPR